MPRGAGKTRGLQQIATRDGVFVMSAMDHRDSMRKMLEQASKSPPGYRDMVERKIELCAALAPHSSAVLLDPEFGAAPCIASGVLPGSTGLLVSIEDTGYEGGKEARVTTLLADWGVEKIKRMGASAVKILIHYRPDLRALAATQMDLVRRVAEDCNKYDIPFLVETKSYPVEDEVRDASLFARHRPKLVVDTARQVTDLPVEVLKTEFPADMAYEKDEGKLMEMCRELDRASRLPWVLLSAGVDYEMFARQVEIACKAGASGFLGGRAIWQEGICIEDKKERTEYLATVAVDRVKRLAEITTRCGTPWYRKLKKKADELTSVSEGWYERY